MAKVRRKATIRRKPTPELELPTSKTVKAQNTQDHIMLVYGPPGVGKTTFVNDLADRVLFISTDRGTRTLSATSQECGDWSEVDDVLTALENGQSEHYDIVALDHIDDLALMAETAVCEELKIESLGDAGFAKGWTGYKKKLHSLFARLRRLDLGIVAVCHETFKTVRTRVSETERTMPDMSKSAWKVIVPLADVVIYCGFELVGKGSSKKEQRIIITQPTEALYAKDRTNRNVPAGTELLDGSAFMKTFSESPTPRRTKKKSVSKKKAVRRTS